MALLGLISENLIEYQKKILEIWLIHTAIAPTFADHHVLSDIIFNGHCLITINIYIPIKVINLYIAYILKPWLRYVNTDFTLKNCLFKLLDQKSYKPYENILIDHISYKKIVGAIKMDLLKFRFELDI